MAAGDEAGIDLWIKDMVPSPGLRRWFGHDPARWPGFRDRYRTELAGNAVLDELLAMMKRDKPVMLLFGARDLKHNNAVALQDFLRVRS